MLKELDYSELPIAKRSNKNREFAKQEVQNFLELTCDGAKVTGWPLPRTITAKRSAMKEAIKDCHATARVRVLADKDDIYLMRIR